MKSSVTVGQFSEHFGNIMQISGEISEEQQNIKSKVIHWCSEIVKCDNKYNNNIFTTDKIAKFNKCINKGCSPGIDGVTSEHLKYANGEILQSHLSVLYNIIIKYCYVPNLFSCGVIIPILKKSSLNPNAPTNYGPITLSSVRTKLVEMAMLPKYEASENQFGFRKTRSTSFGCTLLNDIMCYIKYKHSPLYICSLDAEKCSDSIWHPALFYRLKDNIPDMFWMFIVTWHRKSMLRIIKWKGQYGKCFSVTRSTRQGSIWSSQLFNILV